MSKLARGAPTAFIAANTLGAVGVGTLSVLDTWGTFGATPRIFGDLLLLIVLLAAVWVNLLVAFFRDPERAVGAGFVSPCDGRVRAASHEGPSAHASIVLGVLDVHVIRSPIEGHVEALDRKPGGRRLAFSKDSHLNERVTLTVVGPAGVLALTLIAGAFADRIEPYVKVGDALARGERLGIIKFGSRVDLTFTGQAPLRLLVRPGDTVKAGQTTLLAAPAEATAP